MNVTEFKSRLFTRIIEYKAEHDSYFKQFHAQLEKSPTIEDIWEKLCDCWNFFNYTLLKSLIRRLRFNDLKQELTHYLNSLQKFQCNTNLCNFAKYYCPLRRRFLEISLKELKVHFNLDWEVCTLEDLDELQDHIRCICQIPSCCTVLREISRGSLIVTWSIPRVIASHANDRLRNDRLSSVDVKSFYEEHNILSININCDENADLDEDFIGLL